MFMDENHSERGAEAPVDAAPTHRVRTDLAEQPSGRLSSARGLVLGLVIGALLWVGLFVLLRAFF